jgi:hypothetical protein
VQFKVASDEMQLLAVQSCRCWAAVKHAGANLHDVQLVRQHHPECFKHKFWAGFTEMAFCSSGVLCRLQLLKA